MLTVEKQLATVALGLPPKRRARLAELLIQSMGEDKDGQIAEVWAAESLTRAHAFKKGRLKSVPLKKAFGFDV